MTSDGQPAKTADQTAPLGRTLATVRPAFWRLALGHAVGSRRHRRRHRADGHRGVADLSGGTAPQRVPSGRGHRRRPVLRPHPRAPALRGATGGPRCGVPTAGRPQGEGLPTPRSRGARRPAGVPSRRPPCPRGAGRRFATGPGHTGHAALRHGGAGGIPDRGAHVVDAPGGGDRPGVGAAERQHGGALAHRNSGPKSGVEIRQNPRRTGRIDAGPDRRRRRADRLRRGRGSGSTRAGPGRRSDGHRLGFGWDRRNRTSDDDPPGRTGLVGLPRGGHSRRWRLAGSTGQNWPSSP